MAPSPLYLTGDLLDRMDLVITKIMNDNEPRRASDRETINQPGTLLFRVYLRSRVRFNLEPFSYLYGKMKQNHVRIQLHRVRDDVERTPFVSVGTIIHDNVSNTSQHMLPYSGLLGDLSCRLLTLHRLSDKAISYSAYQGLATQFYGHSNLSSEIITGFAKLVGDRGLLASWVMSKLANPIRQTNFFSRIVKHWSTTHWDRFARLHYTRCSMTFFWKVITIVELAPTAQGCTNAPLIGLGIRNLPFQIWRAQWLPKHIQSRQCTRPSWIAQEIRWVQTRIN